MQFQPDSSGHAGSALRTTGDPRRGRCEMEAGAFNASSFSERPGSLPASAHHRAIPIAPRRFAPPATRSSGSSLAGASRRARGAKVFSGSVVPRGPAAPRPRAGQPPCFSLFLLSFQRPSSRATAPLPARVPRREIPGRPSHAHPLSSTSLVSRSKQWGPLHNQRLQLTRFASLACS